MQVFFPTRAVPRRERPWLGGLGHRAASGRLAEGKSGTAGRDAKSDLAVHRRRQSWLGGLGRRATLQLLPRISFGEVGWAIGAASPLLADDGLGWEGWAA